MPAEIQVTIDDTDVFPRVVVKLQGVTADRQEKLDTWNEVYKIKERVEGEFLALREKVGADVAADNEAGFLTGLEQQVRSKAAAARVSPFNYWRARVYRAVQAMDHASRDALRLAIQQSAPSVQAMEELFFN
ncbi:MAG: hypothetical protein IPK97_05825 [Ahniella sp.]|nr:hypothetical protein [Ahniella sp.]